ncbi:MAG: hypothetical protein GY754_10350 [bacterium]|nr:hypothetical protein [bacterium]
MELTFTQKLILEKIELSSGYQKIHLCSYLKKGYIERALDITITENNVASKLYFSSNDFGTATWINGSGITDSHRWETEDDLAAASYLSRRYPAMLQNGIVPPEYSKEMIVPDVLNHLLDDELTAIVTQIVENDSSDVQYDWDQLINRYKDLNKDFVDMLIHERKQKSGCLPEK